MESPILTRLRGSASSSPHLAARSRHASECEPLQIVVKKSSKYLGPHEIPNCYLMFSFPRGQALIINNEYFDERTGDGSSYRRGSEVDGNNLETLFNELEFEVDVQRNLTRNQMLNSIRDFADSEKHSRSDMAVVAILSHGTDGFLYGTDRCALDTEWIVQQLNNENCIYLRGKPKFFILQACRGFSHDYGTPTRQLCTFFEADSNEGCERTDIDAEVFHVPRALELRSPTVEDILIASSTIPGYVANRDTVRGSWFIECICKVFMSYAATTDIRDMLDKVSMEMSSYVSETGTKQTCSYEVRHFYKKLFFNPGIGPPQSIAHRRRSKLYSSPNTRPRSISDPYQLQFGVLDLDELLLSHPQRDEGSESISISRKSSCRRRNYSVSDLLE